MALINGTNLVLYVHEEGTDKAFGHSRSFTLNIEANAIDATSRESAGWSEYIMGTRSFSLDFDGLVNYADNINEQWLFDAMKTQKKFLVKFTDNLSGPLVFNGYVYLTSLSVNAPTEDVVTYSGSLQGTEIFATAISPDPTPGGDADATAFLTAAGITDATQTAAINGLVEDLKAANLWSKFYAIYPFVGGTAATHKFNLKNPVDSDAAYRLQFNGTWLHDANGALPSSNSAYGNTFLNGKAVSNLHLSYYSITSENATYFDNVFGLTDYSSMDVLSITMSIRTSNTASASMNLSSADGANTDGKGFYIASRNSSLTQKLFKNGSVLASATSTSASPAPMTGNLFFGSLNDSTGSTSNNQYYKTNKQCAFASIGTGLTDAEAATFYTIVQEYQTALSRNV